MNNEIHCIIQARINSTRLPGKIFLNGYDKTLLDHLIERLNFSKKIKKIILASPIRDKNELTNILIKRKNLYKFFGNEKNVLDRYYKCANKFNSKIIIRITSDNPLIDHKLIDEMLKVIKNFAIFNDKHDKFTLLKYKNIYVLKENLVSLLKHIFRKDNYTDQKRTYSLQKNPGITKDEVEKIAKIICKIKKINFDNLNIKYLYPGLVKFEKNE